MDILTEREKSFICRAHKLGFVAVLNLSGGYLEDYEIDLKESLEQCLSEITRIPEGSKTDASKDKFKIGDLVEFAKGRRDYVVKVIPNIGNSFYLMSSNTNVMWHESDLSTIQRCDYV